MISTVRDPMIRFHFDVWARLARGERALKGRGVNLGNKNRFSGLR